ncbi:hypothetical protein C7M41_00021 [Pediococcus acidilactici]|uniref:DUF1642 domain-containing protein n=1 Tax=Pediococcus acidilactici TaxID=1254 RepID=UPI001363C689|nr:DUF1642 domain-containing protein [Pediococcus acidilactici]QHM51351.1 hypothetical protein C7M41_00021 [Pediococcus acidilactici]
MDIKEIKRRLTDLRDERSFAAAIETDKGVLGEYLKGSYEAYRIAVDMLEHLESEKVVVPYFVADWIEEAKEHYGSEIDPLNIVYWTGDYISDTDPHYEWLENICNQKLLLNAVINGYEVKKEPKYQRNQIFQRWMGELSMENVYVVRLGDLYYQGRDFSLTNDYRYTMTDNLNDAILSESFDDVKKLAEDIGGKVYKINLEEVE